MLDKILDYFIETDEEESARKAREAAAAQGQANVNMDKRVYEDNLRATAGLEDALFGGGMFFGGEGSTPYERDPESGLYTFGDGGRLPEDFGTRGWNKTLPEMLDASYRDRQSAADKLKAAIDGVDRVDPGEFQDDWLVDANKEYISPEAKAAQKLAMDKTLALTDIKETAEEKFMREVARRSQERDLRAQSEAQASQLRARGAYGSGPELAGFLGSQQELAQRRSLEEMEAKANAQKRAMQALDQYGNQAFQLGQQDIAVGGLRDVNDRFNKTNKQNWQQFKTKTEQEENDAELKREATKYDADQSLQDDKRTDINTNMDAKFRLLGAKTGTNLAGAAAMKDSRQGLAANFRDEANRADAKHASSNIDWGL